MLLNEPRNNLSRKETKRIREKRYKKEAVVVVVVIEHGG